MDATPMTMPCAEIAAAGLTPLRPAADPGFQVPAGAAITPP
jgi:hypothetical protein